MPKTNKNENVKKVCDEAEEKYHLQHCYLQYKYELSSNSESVYQCEHGYMLPVIEDCGCGG